MSNSFVPDRVNICSYFYPNGKDIPEIIEALKTIPAPSALPNKDVYVDPDDPDEFVMTYSDAAPEMHPPTSDSNSLITDIEENPDDEVDESRIHIHSVINGEDLEKIIPEHVKRADALGDVEMSRVDIYTELDEDVSVFEERFTTGSLPLDLDTTGILFEDDEKSVWFGEAEEGTFLRFGNTGVGEVTPSSIQSVVANQIDFTEGVIEEIER